MTLWRSIYRQTLTQVIVHIFTDVVDVGEEGRKATFQVVGFQSP